MKIAVIGAGISGVSSARMLQGKGHEVVVFEKREKAGGLIRCDVVSGHLFHRTGGHVFNAKDKNVSDWFWSHFDREAEFIRATRNAKIWMNGKYFGYPIENYLYQLEAPVVEKIIGEVLALQATGYRDAYSYANFEEFLLGNFGATLYELYFNPYNAKIWKTDLSLVAMHWLEGKLPMPNYRQMLLNNILRQEEKQMVHSTFYYPKNGGSQFIIDRLSEGLTIYTQEPIERITFQEENWQVNGNEKFDAIVYTGDVRKLGTVLDGINSACKESLSRVERLPSNGTSNMLCETDDTDLSWLYLPGNETKAHRIIYTGNFSRSNHGTGRKSCVVEFSGYVSEEDIRVELPTLPGHLKPIAYNYEPNSYVIQQRDTREKIATLKKQLAPNGFYLTGRFAEWEYYNMDKAIEASIKTIETFAY